MFRGELFAGSVVGMFLGDACRRQVAMSQKERSTGFARHQSTISLARNRSFD